MKWLCFVLNPLGMESYVLQEEVNAIECRSFLSHPQIVYSKILQICFACFLRRDLIRVFSPLLQSWKILRSYLQQM